MLGADAHSRTNVLIASSQERVVSVCSQQLLEVECQLNSCRSAVECLDWLRRQRVDVLILDAAIPWGGADGILELLSSPEAEFGPRPLVFLVMTEVAAALLYRVGRYQVDDFQLGLHDQANLGVRVRRLARQRQPSQQPAP